jgi:hypothetical protein
MNIKNSKFLSLSETEMVLIDGGGIIKDIIEDYYAVRDFVIESGSDFVNGFTQGFSDGYNGKPSYY